MKGVDLFMCKGYIGTTRYVPSASRLTDDYGYNGDIAYVIDEANRKVSSEWTKYNGHWIEVQTGSSGGGSIPTLEDDIPVTVSAGGIQIGTFYASGTEFETIFRNLLNPVACPTLTNPSCTISTTSPTIVERGSTVNATINATFSRGKINPAYGTSGNRSGVIKNYAINGGSTQASNTFNVTVDESHNSYVVTASYNAGEQPKDSAGNNYSSPLPEGSVNSEPLEFEFVDAWWVNSSNASTIEKQTLISKKPKTYTVNFPPCDENNPEVFDVPTSWTITAIEIYNDLTSKWEDCSDEFTMSTVTHENSSGDSVTYNRYTCILPYEMDARNIKIRWS